MNVLVVDPKNMYVLKKGGISAEQLDKLGMEV